MLPLLTPVSPRVAEVGGRQERVHEALEDFARELPHGLDDYRDEVRQFALRLYDRAAGEGARWFVDKSPVYSLVVDELIRVFPDGKFVFLWRNPLAVVASVVETFFDGAWRTPPVLFTGTRNLVEAYAQNRDRSFAVCYESLIRERQPWKDMAAYLGLDFDAGALEQFSAVHLNGRLGDPTGVHRYRSLSAEPLEKWRRVINNPVRKEWCRRYLHWIGRERLATMGYDLDALLRDLKRVPTGPSGVAADVASVLSLAGREIVKARLGRGAEQPMITRLLAS
jgi:hypothetical protein